MKRWLPAVVRRWTAAARRRLDPDRRVVAVEFDRAFYLAAYPDVAAAGADPLTHFMTHGWRDGRDPNASFSVREYLHNNPDVAAAGANPFAHYLRAGRAEGRTTGDDLGFRYQIIVRQTPVSAQVAAAAAATAAVRTDPTETLAAALAGARPDGLHVTFSHDDFRTNVGGVQLCLQQELAGLRASGRDHLHLHPPRAWPILRAGEEEGRLAVLLNGEDVGVFAPAEVAAALARTAGARSFAIHSLLGHRVDEVIAILEAARLDAGFYWLHDYASLCAGHHLLRNGVQDCGAPPPDSAACGICIHGPWRTRHLVAHDELFRRVKLTVVSPAPSTLAFWRARWSFPAAGHLVHPHATLQARGPAAAPPADRPLRVAYLGFPVAHKGWPIFRGMALKYAADPRYAFFHLGAQPSPGLPMAFHEVRVSGARPRAMQETLEALEIDVVVFWPLWRETFSFTAYEAIAAGCAVVTGPDSGNVAALVAEGDRGWVAPDPEALDAAFESGEITGLSRARRKPLVYDMIFSGMTVDLLPARAEA